QAHEEKGGAESAQGRKGTANPLEGGVMASTEEGKPISAKYEVDDGKLQLSVYTMKGNQFSEVIVDHATGKVAKAEPITKDDDLKAAKEQRAAMAKAKRSLPVAEIMLLKGTEWKTVAAKLD